MAFTKENDAVPPSNACKMLETIYPLYLDNTVSHAAVPYAALSLLWYKETWLALLARWRRWTRWTSGLLSLV